jgi:autoinducer 2-degrading protein
MIVVVSIINVQPGTEQKAEAILIELTRHCTAEAGNLVFTIHHSVEDPHRFLIYEQYDAQDSFDLHLTSPHFARYFKGELMPLIESQDGGLYNVISLPDRYI